MPPRPTTTTTTPRVTSSSSSWLPLLWLLLIWSTTLCATVATAQRPAVVAVSKSRYWLPDVFRNFRKSNATAPTLPKWAIPVEYPLVSKHTAVVDSVNQRVVVFGGDVPDAESPRRPGGLASSKIYQLDIRSNKWYTEQPFTAAPAPRMDHIAWMRADTMWVHGGKGADDNSRADIWSYRNRTWRRHGHDGPRLMGHSATWVASNAMLVFGGKDDLRLSNRLYNAHNGTFVEVAAGGEVPTPRAFHAAAFVNNTFKGPRLFIMGGFDGHRALSDIYYLEHGKNQWVLLNLGRTDPLTSYDGVQIRGVEIPGMMRHVCGGDFPLVICVGGEGGDGSKVVEYDMFLNRWIPTYTSNPEMVSALSGGAGFVYSSGESGKKEFWIVGGLTGAPKGYNFPRAVIKTNTMTEKCPQGYVNADYDGRCLLCPVGSAMFFEKNPHRCELCPAGTFEKYGECRKCPKSTYQPKNGTRNATACLPCPAGFFTITDGANSIEDCITCPIGTYAVPYGCAKCPAGTYGIAAGKEAMDLGCSPCNFGSWSDPGSLSCSMCAAGSSSGPFIERLRPHRITLVGMGVVLPPAAAPGGCPASAALTQVTAGTWFYVIFSVSDYGTDGTNGLYDPMRRDYNAPHITGVTDITVEFEGDVSRMYYNCPDQALIPSCSSVTVNQTTPARNNVGFLNGCNNNNNQNYYIVFALRFDETSFQTTVRFRSSGILGAEYPLKIVARGERVNITDTPAFYVESQPISQTFRALDLLLAFDPTATDTFTLRAVCLRGVINPRFKVNGAAAATIASLTFVNGLLTRTIEVVDEGQQCTWQVVRNGVTALDSVVWWSQLATTIRVSFAPGTAENVTSGGYIAVEGTVRNSTGDIVTGDFKSRLQLSISPNRPYSQYLHLTGDTSLTVTAGMARFKAQVRSNHPSPTALVSGTFTLTMTSGITPLPAAVESEKFLVASRRNGSVIELITNTYPFPTKPALNKTFTVEMALKDAKGNIDGSRHPKVFMQVVGCPGIKLALVNTSTPFVFLVGGYGKFKVRLLGTTDASTCRVLFHEVGYAAEKESRGTWSPFFDTLTPHHLRHTSTCKPAACVGCAFEVGQRLNISVGLVSLSGVDVFGDDSTVVKMVVTGNESAVREYQGRPERMMKNSAVTFELEFLASDVEFDVMFVAGYWTTRGIFNITYVNSPTFRAFGTRLGTQLVFHNNHIQSALMCSMTTRVSTTQMVVVNRIPSWVPNDEPFLIEVAATNDDGIVNRTYQGTFTIEVANCYHGLKNDFTWSVIRDKTYTPVSLVGTIAGGTFSSGVARIKVIPKYITQTYFDSGLKACSIRIKAGTLRTLYVENFEVRKVFPSCTMCEPGYWSAGGTGVSATVPFHPGGCVKCMIGTFATTTGSTSEAACQVCPVGYGVDAGNWGNWLDEGLTQCTNTCPYGTNGLAGGGPCPAGNIQQLTNADNLNPGTYGRLGRRCSNAFCNGVTNCPVGQFRLVCAGLGGGQAACEAVQNAKTCLWNVTANACQGPTTCLPCTPGTVQPYGSVNAFAAACTQCNPGGWSSNWGHSSADVTDIQYEPFRCDGTFTWYNRRCTGAGTGQCWNGTASATLGATSNATCLVCGRGTYAHQRIAYRRLTCGTSPCPNLGFTNPFCNYGNCYNCPLSELGTLIGARTCQPCPPGTYQNETGRWDPFLHCIPCPAGTYCPAGSAEPQTTDTWNTRLDLSGTTKPEAVSFEENEDRILCTTAAVSNHPGYVSDGRFSKFRLRNYRQTDTIRKAYKEAWHNDPNHYIPYTISTTDRLGSATSGSARCNATGCAFYQVISLNHLVKGDLIARLWVFNGLESRNITGVMRPALSEPRPFAGFTVRLYNHSNFSLASSIVVGRSIPVTPLPTNTWIALEATIRPPWPVAFATFNITAQAYYQGYALFDDAQLRPSLQRICNCSTGFYYNESRPERPCTRCPPGFACSGGMLTRCEESWSVSAEPGCNRCRPGWQCDADGRGRSIPCAEYTYKSNETESCKQCPLGYACQDGEIKACDGGTYGDGGKNCVKCLPGYYSLVGSPVRECTRCAPGTMADHMRTGCITCPADTYSADGNACLECPIGSFAALPKSGACTSCTSLFMQKWNYTVTRNSETRLAVVPALCVEHYDWAIESIHHLGGQSLGDVGVSPSSIDAIRYRAGPGVGNHTFNVFVTPAQGAAVQRAEVTVMITNRFPLVQDDDLTIPHPTTAKTMDLSFLLFNDYDPDTDPVFFANVGFNGASYGATNLQLSADRRTLTVDLPAGFTGPAKIAYSVMDQYHTLTSQCFPPDCMFSWNAQVTITAKDAPPSTTADYFDVLNGLVYDLDVMKNDTDPDGDDINIIAVGTSLFGANPGIGAVCTIGPTCGFGTCAGISACTCAVDANRQLCWPSVGRRYVISYAAPATRCGTDQFQYTIQTNDGIAYGTVYARVRRCYCAAHPSQINLIFAVDATIAAKDFKWQMSFVDAVQKRAAAGAVFQFGLFGVGQSTRWQNLSTAHIDFEYVDPNYDGGNFPYALGAAMFKIGDGTATSAFGTPPATRRSVLIVIAGSESTDDPTAAGGALASTYTAGMHVITISVNPNGDHYSLQKKLSPLYSVAVKNWDVDLQNPQIAYDIMDAICSLP